MKVLEDEIITFLKTNGANLAGISNVARFNGAPRGHHPCDFVSGARSVVTFGIALLRTSLNWEDLMSESEFVPQEHRKDVLQNYLYSETGYVLVNHLLDMLGLRLAGLLQERGFASLFFPATYGRGAMVEYIQKRIPSGLGLFSQRHAAVRAGLGEFGLNNIVVTPKYGPRMRFSSVITEAELEPSPLLKDKACLGENCSICVRDCPGAISLRAGFDPAVVWIDPPAQTDIAFCRGRWNIDYCWGRCVKVCPVGARSRGKSE